MSEQAKTVEPTPAMSAAMKARLDAIMRDTAMPPHERFAMWLKAWGLNDQEAADLLAIPRPTVQRTREATRPPSADVAACIETLTGIPAGHWRPVPDSVVTAARKFRPAVKGRKAT